MTFQQGSVEFGYSPGALGTSADVFSLEGQFLYQTGSIGLQFDAKAAVLTDYSSSLNEYLIGIHAYKPFANGVKLGGYGAYSLLTSSGGGGSVSILDTRGEGIFQLGGAVDLEASVGALTFFDSGSSSASLGIANRDIFYAISPSFEVSAGSLIAFSSSGTTSTYRVGASYELANMPVTLGLTYGFDGSGNDSLGLTASYAFGGPASERQFRGHGYPLNLGG